MWTSHTGNKKSLKHPLKLSIVAVTDLKTAALFLPLSMDLQRGQMPVPVIH